MKEYIRILEKPFFYLSSSLCYLSILLTCFKYSIISCNGRETKFSETSIETFST